MGLRTLRGAYAPEFFAICRFWCILTSTKSLQLVNDCFFWGDGTPKFLIGYANRMARALQTLRGDGGGVCRTSKMRRSPSLVTEK